MPRYENPSGNGCFGGVWRRGSYGEDGEGQEEEEEEEEDGNSRLGRVYRSLLSDREGGPGSILSSSGGGGGGRGRQRGQRGRMRGYSAAAAAAAAAGEKAANWERGGDTSEDTGISSTDSR